MSGAPPPRSDSPAAVPAAALYAAVLLACWLLAAELLHLGLGESPRLVLLGAQVLGILVPALLLTRALASLGLAPSTSRRPPPSAAALAGALPGLAIGGYLVGLALHYWWLRMLQAGGWSWVEELDRQVQQQYARILDAGTPGELVLVLLMVGLVPAVCEEVAFRRGLQGLLTRRLGGAGAVLAAAAVFAVFHLEPFGLPTRFFLGISLGIAYHRTGALWTAGVLHAAHNLATVGGLHLADRSGAVPASALEGLEGIPPGLVATLGALGLGGWLVSLGLLRPAPEAAAA